VENIRTEKRRRTDYLGGGINSGSLTEMASNAVSDRMDYVIVNVVGHIVGEVRCPVRNAFARKRGRVLGQEKLHGCRAN
jgi:hypothetical protein